MLSKRLIIKNYTSILESFLKEREFVCVCSFMKNFYVFGGYKRVASKSSCFVFKCSESHWSYIESMNSKRHCAACEFFEGIIVVSGDIDSRTVLRSLEAYDHHGNRWGRLPDMIETRYRQSLVTSGNKLYAIGGVEEYSWEVFDNKTRKFTPIRQNLRYLKVIDIF